MVRYRSKMRMDARTYLMIRDSKFYRDDFSLVAKIKEVAKSQEEYDALVKKYLNN